MAENNKASSGQFASQAVPMDQRMKTTSLFGAMSGFIGIPAINALVISLMLEGICGFVWLRKQADEVKALSEA